MKVQANDFTIFWEGKAIAYATTAELDVSADTYEIGSATSGGWRKYKKGRKGWTISAGHLFDLRNPWNDGSTQRTPWQLFMADEEIDIAFGAILPHDGQAAESQEMSGTVIYTGKVLVRRYTVSAVKGQFVTCQFEAVGCGALDEYRARNIYGGYVDKGLIMQLDCAQKCVASGWTDLIGGKVATLTSCTIDDGVVLTSGSSVTLPTIEGAVYWEVTTLNATTEEAQTAYPTTSPSPYSTAGTLYAIRAYNRALDATEKSKNAAIDKERFGGSGIFDVEFASEFE